MNHCDDNKYTQNGRNVGVPEGRRRWAGISWEGEGAADLGWGSGVIVGLCSYDFLEDDWIRRNIRRRFS